MISRGFWEINGPISSINTISRKLDISMATVRNVLKQFERDGILECWGRLGFYLVSDSTRRSQSRNHKFLTLIQTNLKAFDILHNKGIKKRNWLVRFDSNSNKVFGLNEVSGLSIEASLEELTTMQKELLSLSTVLAIVDVNEFKETKKKFDRQREILPLARIVLNNKKELGINE
jgi:DNA-binding transcriptional regulator YhcF (GntR family)